MPIYEYRCEQCDNTIDVLQKVSDPPPATCAQCGAEHSLKRKVSRTSFVLKGGGWYADLYGSPKKDSKGSEDSSAGGTGATASTASSGNSSSGGTSTTTTATAAAPTK